MGADGHCHTHTNALLNPWRKRDLDGFCLPHPNGNAHIDQDAQPFALANRQSDAPAKRNAVRHPHRRANAHAFADRYGSADACHPYPGATESALGWRRRRTMDRR